MRRHQEPQWGEFMTVNHRNRVRQAVARALAVSAVAVLGAGSVLAQAQQAAPATPMSKSQKKKSQAPQLKTIIVTGSLIRTANFDTPSPIQVITSKAMLESGFTSLSSVLRNISANGAGTLSQAFGAAFAGGGAGVALRGLTVGATLTLIDGERMVPYPLSDDGQRDFVDVSSLPMDAVERVDVLKDGASAVYGSDAIAGVVNVILRPTFQGLSAGYSMGSTIHADGTTEHFHAIGGIGNLATDGYNAYLAVEFRHQDPIWLQNRSGFWTNQNWIPYGGYNTQHGAVDGVDPLTAQFPFIPGGYVLNPATNQFDSSAQFVNPNLASSMTQGNCTGYSAWTQDQCITPTISQIQPQDGNIDMLGRFTKMLGAHWRAITTASWFRSESEQRGFFGAYPTVNNLNPVTNIAIAAGVAPHPVTLTPVLLPVGAPNNPFNAPAEAIFNFPQFGANGSTTQYVTNTYRLFEALKGGVMGWHIDANVGYMYDETKQTVLGSPSIAQFNKDATSGVNFAKLTWGQYNALFPNMTATDSNKMFVADVHGTHKIMELPGGPLTGAIGVGYYRLEKNSPAPLPVALGLQGGNNAYVVGTQSDYNVYGELEGKPIKGLTLDVAYRLDHYASYGNSTTPKFAVKYQPFNWLTLRGTYAKGFRAPNPAEAGQAAAAFGGFPYNDPILCPGGNPAVAGVFPSQCNKGGVGLQTTNPKLLPETSRSYTFGFILQPTPATHFSVDYWDIKINRDIQSGVNLFFLGALSPAQQNALFPVVRGPAVSLPYNVSCTSGGTCTTAVMNTGTVAGVGPELYQLFPYINATTTQVNGLDLNFGTHFGLGRFGELQLQASLTHNFHYIFGAGGVSYDLAGTHGPSIISGDTGNPKDRGSASIAWRYGPDLLRLTTNFIGHYTLTDPSNGQPTCQSAITSAFADQAGLPRFPGTSTGLSHYCTVSHFTYTNLYFSHAFADGVIGHISVVNLFNQAPPVDLATYGANNAEYSPALTEVGAVGTMIMVGADYRFE